MTSDGTVPRPAERTRRLLLNAVPSIAFVVVYFAFGNMQKALDALVFASIIAFVIGLVSERRMLPLPLIIGVMGLMTAVIAAIFHDAYVLKLKLTIVHVVIGGTLIGLALLRLNPFRDPFTLTETGWRRLMLRYGMLSLAIAAANVVIWRTQPDSVWVFFHFPGVPLINVAFLVTQVPWLRQDRAKAQKCATRAARADHRKT